MHKYTKYYYNATGLTGGENKQQMGGDVSSSSHSLVQVHRFIRIRKVVTGWGEVC